MAEHRTIVEFKRPGQREAFLFAVRAALSACLSLLLYSRLGWSGSAWAAVSALIVIQTSLQSSVKASLARFAANLVGAFAGAGCALLPNEYLALALGILVTGLVCHWLRLDDSRRPGFAAVAIIVLTSEGHALTSSVERLVAVTIGCIVALVVTLSWESIAERLHKGEVDPNQAPIEQGAEG